MLIVQKYGGATVADPQKIKAVALRLAELYREGHQVVAVVSAMGKTTNQLIELANQVSSHPNRRELDMLLTTGERVSMALVSMALHDLGVPAISFTGSQAGILTDDSHFNAHIQEVKAFRVQEALKAGKVVVLAGFQGVSPITKEITTLGRGGTDSTAVAMAGFLKADHCEILKEVPAVFTADPNLIPSAKVISNLSYHQMHDMTFWGAKVLYHRAAEMARDQKIKLYIGPAAKKTTEGTWVQDQANTHQEVLSVNSHETVLQVATNETVLDRAVSSLNLFLERKEIAPPQVLHSWIDGGKIQLLLSGPSEITSAVQRALGPGSGFLFTQQNLSSVTATLAQAPTSEMKNKLLAKMGNLSVQMWIESAFGWTAIVSQSSREKAILAFHELI